MVVVLRGYLPQLLGDKLLPVTDFHPRQSLEEFGDKPDVIARMSQLTIPESIATLFRPAPDWPRNSQGFFSTAEHQVALLTQYLYVESNFPGYSLLSVRFMGGLPRGLAWLAPLAKPSPALFQSVGKVFVSPSLVMRATKSGVKRWGGDFFPIF